MTTFEELKNRTLEEQIEGVNMAMKQASKPFKNSRTFAKETGLNVVFSKIEKYFNKKGYTFNEDKSIFVKQKQNTQQEENPDALILNYLKNEEKGTVKKGSFPLYEDAQKELQEIYEKYPYFSKTDILYVIIKEGVKSLK